MQGCKHEPAERAARGSRLTQALPEDEIWKWCPVAMSVTENSKTGGMKENTNVEKESLGLCNY